MSTDTQEVDLRTYLGVLRRRKWWVILFSAVFVVGALAYSFAATTEYSATAQLLVQPQNGNVTFTGTPQTITPTDVATELQLLTGAPVVDAVKARLHLSQLNVKVAEQGQTDVIVVTATNHRPAQAALVANSYAKEFVNYETSLATKTLTNLALELQRQISAIDQELTSAKGTPQQTALANQEAVLKEQAAQLAVSGAETTGGVVVTSLATAPTIPSSPKKVENGLIGLVVGLLVGLGAAFVVDSLDDAVYSTDDLERAAPHVPVMATVPIVGSWRNRGMPVVVSLSEPTGGAAEAYRSLRTSLQFMAQDSSIGSVLVTSPMAGEGKTSTISNLGVVLAKVGQRVVLVSADLRQPRLASFFGLDESVGLTSVMIGESTLDDALQPVPDVPGLTLLGCGPRPPDPAELLSSPAVTQIFDGLTQRFDMILVDSAPLIPVTDPLLLCPFTDATLLVVAAGQTKKGQLQRACERLAQASAKRVGIVFNEVKGETEYGYNYGYSHAYNGSSVVPSSNGHAAEPAPQAFGDGPRGRQTTPG